MEENFHFDQAFNKNESSIYSFTFLRLEKFSAGQKIIDGSVDLKLCFSTIHIFLVLGIVRFLCISIQHLMLCAKQGSMWGVRVFLEAIPDIFMPSNDLTICRNDCKPPTVSYETRSQCRPTLLPPKTPGHSNATNMKKSWKNYS